MRFTVLAAALCASAIAPSTHARATVVDRPITLPPATGIDVTAGSVKQVGEIVVMEGDDQIVTTTGPGAYMISPDNLSNIVARFYLQYPDEFDGIAVILTFPDGALGGAYATCGEASVKGLGMSLGGCGGGMSSRLLSVVNMNGIDQYGSMDVNDDNWFAFIGQEFGHSWLEFFTFIDPLTGAESTEMLGRQSAHYAAAVQAFGSVMDGVNWQDNGDGTFTVLSIMDKYSKLDLYAMGIIPPEEVPPFYIIRNAHVLPSGDPLDPVFGLPQLAPGTKVMGNKLDLTLDDITKADGPRVPAWDAKPEEFREAFVLVTAPGETADMAAAKVAKLDVGRLAWEQRFATETENRGFICTDVSAPCPRAAAKVISATVSEGDQSNHDGIIEPGETAKATVMFQNTGGADATTAVAAITSAAAGVKLPASMTLPTIPVNQTISVDFPLQITGDACGQTIDLQASATIDQRTWKASFSMRPGVVEGPIESFATDAGWKDDFLFTDTAMTGQWQYGVPHATFFGGRKLQPDGGHGGATDKAWFTDISDNWDTGEVSGGQTTLTTSIYDLSKMYKPTLRYWLWYTALDRPSPSMLVPATDPHLLVEASGDGGNTWTQIDAVTGGPFKWALREAPITLDQPSAQVRFRFTALDDMGTSRIVEVGIDDVQIINLADSCMGGGGGGGCGCRVGARTTATPLALLALGAIGFVVSLRRRRR